MSYSDEFPLLEGVRLYASDISGDGNCLFHALSDQLYGHENNHLEIRKKVVEHMRDNAPYFKLFLDVGPTRRAPKRKAASNNNNKGHKNAAVTAALPSESAIDVAFTQHLIRMARPGVYGDNMEISAFSREYGCDVKIYQRDFAYVVTGGEGGGDEGGEGKKKKVLHIAYHNEQQFYKLIQITNAIQSQTWEHYSSVRNRDGPHTGPPNVSPVPLTEEERKEQEKKLANSSYVQPWMVKAVTSSLPYLVDSRKIREVLEEAKGNIDAAVSKLLDVEEEEQEEEEQEEEEEQQQAEEGEHKGHANKSKDVKEKEKVDVTLGEGERIKETEAERADAQGSSEAQDNVDRVNDLAADADGVKTGRRPAPKISARASARIRAREDSRSNPGSGPENSGSAAEETRKQQPLHPKKETARERKARQKAAAKQRKKGGALGNKDAELEKGTVVITTGIRELYI